MVLKFKTDNSLNWLRKILQFHVKNLKCIQLLLITNLLCKLKFSKVVDHWQKIIIILENSLYRVFLLLLLINHKLKLNLMLMLMVLWTSPLKMLLQVNHNQLSLKVQVDSLNKKLKKWKKKLKKWKMKMKNKRLWSTGEIKERPLSAQLSNILKI